ncbi:hypothetical protein GTW40_08240 [Streptomyces sp. SID4985]|uniref:DUF6000 family protein n=1 Tax=Streptomyces sp. SID4985 TaxID=2690292 RepID=UPI001368ED2C|nr:hypothetical protein [Streptomyces sp. SID4985]
MRDAEEADELDQLVRQYVTPGRRYLKLGGSLLRMSGPERAEFARSLGEDAGKISDAGLGVLLGGSWRERKTAAWLIAVAGRTEFRERLGELLLASEGPYAGRAYCVALAGFGTAADAGLLVAYLDRYLGRPDLPYDQPAALGALLLLDARLRSDRAARFLTPDGLWERWLDGMPGTDLGSPAHQRDFIEQLCDFAAESGRGIST